MEDSKSPWLIVGASRGIGREFVKQLLGRGDSVWATVRGDTTTLFPEDPNCHVLNCDVRAEAGIHGFVRELEHETTTLNHVVINAGVLRHPNRATEMTFDDFAFHLHTNTIGPILTAQILLKSSIDINGITFVSSDSGSTQSFRDFEDGFAAYAASKAALNQSLRHMAAELKRKGSKTTVLALHPGEVETDMAKNISVSWEIAAKILSVEESVSACIEVVESKGPEDSGTFWTWENKVHLLGIG